MNIHQSRISCLSSLILHCPFARFCNFLNMFVCYVASNLLSQLSFVWHVIFTNFYANLVVEFVFSFPLSWLFTIFMYWPFLYFLLKYSVILIFSAFFVASLCNIPILPSFLQVHFVCQKWSDVFSIILASFYFSSRIFASPLISSSLYKNLFLIFKWLMSRLL